MKRTRAGAIAAIVVVAAGAVVGLWWKPWQSGALTLPKSGCWGILDQNDIRPAVGPDGTATTVSLGALAPNSNSPGGGYFGLNSCYFKWNGRDVASAGLGAANSSALSEAAISSTPVTLAQGIVLVADSSSVDLYFRCVGIPNGSTYGDLQVTIMNGGVDSNGSTSETTRNGFANIALKLAKVAATKVPCSNHLDFPASVPELKPEPQY
ncbi:hypothetical protein [Streptacidiphilus sp. MAP5-3]|uniref:hypothetical protein n=1 Tax=unclassified Streptacidiphilus TaxID=2643834 RepID=UPI003516A453